MATKNVHSSFTKFNWASKQIGDLETACKKFTDAPESYSFKAETNPHTGEVSHYLTGMLDVPTDILCTCGDIIHNLRSALDHAAYYSVTNPTRDTCFPICATPEKLDSAIKARIKEGMRDKVVKAIRRAKPYKGGTDELWMLHELDIRDKHRLLLAVGTAYRGHFRQKDEMLRNLGRNLLNERASDLSTWVIESKPPRILKAGDILITVPKSEAHQDMKFCFDIAFAEPGVAECHPLLETLEKLSNLVAGIVATCGWGS